MLLGALSRSLDLSFSVRARSMQLPKANALKLNYNDRDDHVRIEERNVYSIVDHFECIVNVAAVPRTALPDTQK